MVHRNLLSHPIEGTPAERAVKAVEGSPKGVGWHWRAPGGWVDEALPRSCPGGGAHQTAKSVALPCLAGLPGRATPRSRETERTPAVRPPQRSSPGPVRYAAWHRRPRSDRWYRKYGRSILGSENTLWAWPTSNCTCSAPVPGACRPSRLQDSGSRLEAPLPPWGGWGNLEP